MKRKYGDYIEDIIDSMKKAQKFIKGITYQQFTKDEKTIYAVIRAVEVIGEAAKNIPYPLQKKYPDVPWKDMAGMRDKLIHEYFGIRLDIVWNTVNKELPALRDKFVKILKDFEDNE